MSSVIASRLKRMAGRASLLAAASGTTVLLGYALGSEALTTFLPGHTMARPNAALGLLAGSIALLLLRPESAGGYRRLAGRACAWLMLAIGLATLGEYLLAWNLGIDQILFSETVRNWQPLGPGRMSALTALSLVLLGSGLLGLEWEPRRQWRPAQWAALAVMTTGLLVLLGYTFGERELTSFGASVAMSIPAAVGLGLLAAGLLLARPECGWMRLVSSERAGGALLRAWLPVAVAAIWLLGWLSITGSQAGWYSTTVDQVFFAAPLIFLFVLLIFLSAHSLDRVDEERRRKAEEVEQANRGLEARVAQRTAQLGETISALEREMEERERAEATARGSEARLQLQLDRMPIGCIVWSKDFHVLSWNPAAEQIFGFTAEEVMGKHPYECIVPKAAQPQVGAIYERLLAGDSGAHSTNENITKDGRSIICQWSNTPLKDPGGEVFGVLSMVQDISERQRAEREMYRLNRALATVCQCNQATIHAADEPELLQQVCNIIVRVAGYRLAWIGYKQEDEDKTVQPVAQAGEEEGYLKTAQVTWADEARGRGPSGAAIRTGRTFITQDATTDPRFAPWREEALRRGFRGSIGLPLKEEQEAFGALAIYAQEPNAFDPAEVALLEQLAADLSFGIASLRSRARQKRAEAELRLNERRLEAVLQLHQMTTAPLDEITHFALEEAVRLTGSEVGYLAFVSSDEATLTMHAWSETAMEQCRTQDKPLVYPVAKTGLWGEAVRQRRPVITNDYAAPNPSKRGYPQGHVPLTRHMNLPVLEGERIVLVAGVGNKACDYEEADVRQVSLLMSGMWRLLEHRRAEEEVRVLNAELEGRVQQRTAELEASNRELESFTYSVSHDLRAPLRHVDGFSKILLDEYGPVLDEAGRRYLERVRQGTQFMGRLVDDLLNLSRVGRQSLSVQITGLGSLVEEAVHDLAAEAQGREVEWRVGELPFVECDPGLMKQVLANLLSNALKFTRPRPQAVIEVGRQPGEGAPVLFVRDNGVGFNMKYADKLFGIFQRLHRQEDFEGTGVGLATVERILHKHGGRIWAEAELDKGATFYFTLGAPEATGEQPAEKAEVAA